jgi:hypothetical protein
MTHHGETTQVTQLRIFSHLNDEEIAEKCVDSLAEFSSASKWSMSRLTNHLRKIK